MLTEYYFTFISELFLDNLGNPYLLLENSWCCRQKGKPSLRGNRDEGFKKSFELYKGFVIKGNDVNIIYTYPCLFKAVIYGLMGKVSVVLLPCKSLLLSSGNNFPIFDKAGCRVVVEGGDAEDISTQNCLL